MEVKQKRSFFNPVYKRILTYLRPYRKKFFLALLCMAAYGATDGAVPLIIRSILDDIFGKQNQQMLYALPVVLIIFAIIRGGCGFSQQYLMAGVGLGIVQDVRNKINQHLLGMPPSFFARQTTGALISRVTNDTLLVRSALTDAVSAVLRDSVRIIALLGTAIYLDPVLGLVVFLLFPICIVPIMRFGKKVRKLSRVGQDKFAALTGILQETIVGHRVVQAFSMENFEQSRFVEENKKLTDIFKKAEKYGALSGPTNELIGSLAIAGIILYGGFSVISGVRTQGDFIAFITSLFLLYEPVKKVGRVNTIIQTGISAAERIFEILDEQPEIVDSPQAQELSLANTKIEYQNISFSYRNGIASSTADWAVKDINLVVNPGEMLALVGMSGGGKSTIVNLLLRFYDPQEGRITIGGYNIKDVTLASLRKAVGFVSQQTFLFNDTVYNNIAYGKPEASENEVLAAAKAANAHSFITKLPEGYQTIIGEQGLSLSGGERSRLSIARALLKDAPILVLDEATAALDSESEELVQDAINRLMQGRTVIVIAHRLATVREADKIAVLVNGKLLELGTHDELLQKSGEYAKLYRIQFQRELQDSASGEMKTLAAV